MKFINRKKEMQQLEEIYNLSKRGLMTVAISGLRRVGKTTLIKEFIKDKKALYFFVYESKTSKELLDEFVKELRTKKIISELESIDSWNLFLKTLFERCERYVIIFDEFQNLYSVDRSVFSIMQRNCDENKEKKISIIILGSLISLFKKIFEDKKQPLYGRILSKIRINPFSLKDSLETLRILGFKDIEKMLNLYGLFGGFPKYYTAIEQFNITKKEFFEIIEYLFIQDNAPLENEVIEILKQEFGKRSSLYYSILSAIANGKTKLNEIASTVQMKESSITRHLSELEHKFDLIKTIRPLKNKKNTIYEVNHPLIKFWFGFIYNSFSDYKIRNVEKIMNEIKTNFDSFFGRRFEEICKEVLIKLNYEDKLPFRFDYISKWWGHKRINDERKEVEIDLLCLNEELKKMIITECKWQKNINSQEIVKSLKEKSEAINWNREKREEYYCIIAKSFKNKTKDKNVILLDLNDIENLLNK